MIRSRKTQTVVAVLDAAVVGFIIDRITGSPIFGGIGFIALTVLALRFVPRDFALADTLKVDKEIYEVIRLVAFVILFFIGCIAAAWFILAGT